jgi:hypothetical protein
MDRLRAHEDVEMAVRLDSPAEIERHGGTRRALLLIDGTLLAVRHTDDGWTQRMESENADWVDLLEAVMARVSERRGT